ncbi:hypothetical protein GF391_03675 [Candidatus Uhrbacteria bacterium]|nr:hypothetical protein [Candidatus Uhrbacteria bacterium]
MTHCPICKALYPKEQVKLISEQNNAKLYHSTCATCGHGLFYYVIQGQAGVSAIGLVSDATGADASRMADAGIITGDDCIKAHKIIEKNSQDLCQNLLDIREKLA